MRVYIYIYMHSQYKQHKQMHVSGPKNLVKESGGSNNGSTHKSQTWLERTSDKRQDARMLDIYLYIYIYIYLYGYI